MKTVSRFVLLSVLATGPASASEPVYPSAVETVLRQHCLSCHGRDKLRGGLDLRIPRKALAGGDSGKVVVPGRPDESLLLQLVGPRGKPHMPPRGQLTAAEIRTLEDWVSELKAGAGESRPLARAARTHWAFQKLRPAAPPAVKDRAWGRNPIDAFILARLESAGLKPSAPAGRVALLRRVSFDLIGLPPTPDEVRDAVLDPTDAWYERAVDRLLASPHHGERWGRHWLDLARYADSGGFHNDLDRPHAWRYRDYVIKSFNDDKPYDRFIREQLAGDELDATDPDALAATGFCLGGPTNEDNMGKEREKHRLNELDDVIATTGQVFLGLTLGCARCHDHKYDPVTLTDYYQLLAVFNSTVKKVVPVKGGARVMVLTDDGPRPRPTRVLWRGDLNNPGPEVAPGVPAVLAPRPLEFPTPAADVRTTGRRRTLADWVASPDHPLTWRVLANRVWHYHFGRGLVGSVSNFGLGGDRPTHPELLDWLARELVRNGGRLKPLHRLIVTSAVYRQSSAAGPTPPSDPGNRLLWRMNKRRLEAEAVRDSILAVSGTLNRQRGGPGVKPRIHPALLAGSQRNKWPKIDREGPEHWRRSVYVYVKRQLALPLLELFDSPATTQSCGRREQSVVPTQALVLMNDEFTQDQAGYFADRVQREVGNAPAAQADRALRIAFGRAPGAARQADAVDFLRQQRAAHAKAGADADRRALADLAHVLFNCNEFIYID